MRDSGSGPARRTRSIPRATPRRARVARDGDGDDDRDDVGRLALSRAFGEGEEAEDWEARDGDDDGDDVGRLALSRAFGEGEEAEDWEARDGDDDRDGVRTRARDEGVVEGEGEGRRARGRGAGERGGRGGR